MAWGAPKCSLNPAEAAAIPNIYQAKPAVNHCLTYVIVRHTKIVLSDLEGRWP